MRVETSKTNMSGSMKILFEFFLNGAKLSLNSVISANWGNLINHRSMNWAQFKYPIFHMCYAGAVVVCLSLTQEVAGSTPFNDKYFCHNSVKTFRKSSIPHHKTIYLSVMFQLSLAGIKCLRGKGIIARWSDLDWNQRVMQIDMEQVPWNPL